MGRGRRADAASHRAAALDQSRKEWSLYWRDRNLKFHVYDRTRPTPHVQELLDYLGSRTDPIFFG